MKYATIPVRNMTDDLNKIFMVLASEAPTWLLLQRLLLLSH